MSFLVVFTTKKLIFLVCFYGSLWHIVTLILPEKLPKKCGFGKKGHFLKILPTLTPNNGFWRFWKKYRI